MSITYKLVYQKNCSIKKSDWDVLQVKLKELWQEPKKRSKTYDILDNIFSAITHGIGFGLAVAGLVILIVKAAHTGSPMRVVTLTIYA